MSEGAERPPGRPRSPEVDAAIFDAAMAEYAERGFDALSVDAVAGRSGVGKATIYRRYPSKLDLVTATLYASGEAKQAPDTGTIDGDLRALLGHLHDLVNDPVLGASLRHMAADCMSHPELGTVHEEFVRVRRLGHKAALLRGIDRGELRRDIDLELATDLLTGPVFLRHLFTHLPVDRPFLDRLREEFLRLHRAA